MKGEEKDSRGIRMEGWSQLILTKEALSAKPWLGIRSSGPIKVSYDFVGYGVLWPKLRPP